MMKKKVRRIYVIKDPHKDTRAGHTWGLDTLTWPVYSREGNKYTNVLRDYATGFYVLVHVSKKSNTVAALKEAMLKMRANPR